MNEWDWLVQQAILGTERSNFQAAHASQQLANSDAALRELVESVSTAENSRQFLHTAAIVNQLRCAGYKPAPITPLATLALCPPERLRPVSETAASLLRQLLAGDDARLIGAWLEYAAAAQCHLPADTLLPLLTLATTRRELAEMLAPCLGERGRWLLSLNPAWHMDAAQSVSENDWHLGNIQARVTFLHTLRQREGEKARELLAAVWAQEAAKDRVLLLGALATGLGQADEPFLTACLTDRSEHVRSAAVRLLAKLPTSAPRTILAASLARFLRIERKWLRRTLQVELPESFAPEWQRLAIKEAVPAGESLGQKAWWLAQLLSLTQPTSVAQQLRLEVAELFEFVEGHDFAAALRQGLLQGAELHGDHEFVTLYLQRVKPAKFPAAFVQTASILADAAREGVLLAYLRQHRESPLADWNALTPVLQTFEQLSAALSELLITRCFVPLLAQTGFQWSARPTLREAAYRFAPAGYPRAEVLLRNQREQTPESVEEFLRIYYTRYQIEQAFHSK